MRVLHRDARSHGLAVDGDDLVELLDLPELSGGTVEVALDWQQGRLVDPGHDLRVVPGAAVRDLLDLPSVLAISLLAAGESVRVVTAHEAQIEEREVRPEERIVAVLWDERSDPPHGRRVDRRLRRRTIDDEAGDPAGARRSEHHGQYARRSVDGLARLCNHLTALATV